MSGLFYEQLRAKLSKFPRLGLANLPTPLQHLRRLSQHLDGPTIWVKREDLTGLGMGGNKLRKLDFVLREAMEQGCDAVVSGGVVQSNSQRQVAAAAAKLGLECHLAVFHGRLKPPSVDYSLSGNVLLNKIFGAHFHDVPWTGDRNTEILKIHQQLVERGRRPFMVPYGVSSALGAVGYSSAAAELAEQCQGLGFKPTAIVHCSGSGGTQAGLTVGASVCMPGTRVVGIDIDAEPARVRRDVLIYGRAAAELLGVEFKESEVELVAGHAGPAYGVPHAETVAAIGLAGKLEGLVTDPVYSGKGLAGLMALAGEGRWTKDENVVFVHTGGEPALFAYRDSLEG